MTRLSSFHHISKSTRTTIPLPSKLLKPYTRVEHVSPKLSNLLYNVTLKNIISRRSRHENCIKSSRLTKPQGKTIKIDELRRYTRSKRLHEESYKYRTLPIVTVRYRRGHWRMAYSIERKLGKIFIHSVWWERGWKREEDAGREIGW